MEPVNLYVLLTTLIPLVAYLIYIYIRDENKKEPLTALFIAVMLGISSAYILVLVGFTDKDAFGGLFHTKWYECWSAGFLSIAIPGEFAKYIALSVFLIFNKYYDEWASVAISRSLLAVSGHYAFAVLMGYYYSLYHYIDCSPRIAACILLIPVLAHGFYDTIALGGVANPYIGSISTLVLIYFCVKMHKYARKKIVAQIERDRNERII